MKKLSIQMCLVCLFCVGIFNFGNASEGLSLHSIVEKCLPLQVQEVNDDSFTLEIQEEADLERKSAPTKWVTIKQAIGNEKITLDFPKKPTIKKKDGFYFVNTKLDGSEYSFIAPLPPMGSIDASVFFPLFVEQISKGLSSVEYSITQQGNLHILNLKGLDLVKSEWGKVKVVITPVNFYTMAVVYPEEKQSESQDRFLNSFSVQ